MTNNQQMVNIVALRVEALKMATSLVRAGIIPLNEMQHQVDQYMHYMMYGNQPEPQNENADRS